MKRVTRNDGRWARAAACLAMLVCYGLAHPTPSAAQVVDGIAAVVDSDVILLSELDANSSILLARVQAQKGGELSPEIVRQVQQQALQQLIDQRVMRKYAERVKLAVTPEEIDETVQGIASDEGLEVGAIYAAAEREGLTRDAYRRELGNQITQMKVMSGAVRSRVEVPQEEIEALFNRRFREGRPGPRARVRHILLPWPPPKVPITREQVVELARQIRAQASSSGDFPALARQYSRAPSASSGGLTTLIRAEVAPEIANAVFESPVGSITPLIENNLGVNLFEVLEQFDPSQIQLADVEEQLRAELVERRMEPEFERWITEQRKQYYIEIVVPELK